MQSDEERWQALLEWSFSWAKAGNNTDRRGDANIAVCQSFFDYRVYPPAEFRKVAEMVLLAYRLRKPWTALMEVRERPRGLYFDLEYPKALHDMPEVDVLDVHRALCHCLRLVVPAKDIHRQEAKWRVFWVDGKRPGKPLSFHAHFPYVTCSKESMVEIYTRLGNLVAAYPDDVLVLFFSSILDPAPSGGGLYGPYACKFDNVAKKPDLGTYKLPVGWLPFWKDEETRLELTPVTDPAQAIVLAMPDVLPAAERCVDLRVLGTVRLRGPPAAALALPLPALAMDVDVEKFDPDRDLVSVPVDSDRAFARFDEELAETDGGKVLQRFVEVRFFMSGPSLYWRNSKGALTHLPFRDCHCYDRWNVPTGGVELDLAGHHKRQKMQTLKKAIGAYAPLITSLVFHPTPLGSPIVRVMNGAYNTWLGLEAYKHVGKPFTADVENGIGLWLFTVFRNLTTCELPVLDAYVAWLANIVQFPHKPTEKCPLMVGKPSGGKTRINNNLVRYVFGEAHSTCINTMNDLLGNFTFHDNQIFVYVEEMCPSSMPKLNSIITPTTFGTMCNKKGKEPQIVVMHQNITAASNLLWPFDNMQRRYLCMRTNPVTSSGIQVVGSKHHTLLMRQFADLDAFYAAHGHMLGAWLYRLDIPSLPLGLKDIPSKTYNHLHCEMRYSQLHPYVKALVTQAALGTNHNLVGVAASWMDKTQPGVYRVSEYLTYMKEQTGLPVRFGELMEQFSRFGVSVESRGGTPCIIFPTLEDLTATFLLEEECFRMQAPDGTSTIRNIFEEQEEKFPEGPEHTDFGDFYGFFARYKMRQ